MLGPLKQVKKNEVIDMGEEALIDPAARPEFLTCDYYLGALGGIKSAAYKERTMTDEDMKRWMRVLMLGITLYSGVRACFTKYADRRGQGCSYWRCQEVRACCG